MPRLSVFPSPRALLTWFLCVSLLTLALPVSGPAAVCEQIQSTERGIEELRDRIRTLQVEVAAKKQRWENVRSWMPGVEAQQRLTEDRAAYAAAKAKLPALREERHRIERERLHTRQRKQELMAEKARLEKDRSKVETPHDKLTIPELERKLNEAEAFVLSQLGASPTSAAEAAATAGRVADVSHVIWLQAKDLSIFAREEFEGYQPPSYMGRDGSPLWVLEQNLARQVMDYGAAAAQSPEAARIRSGIVPLVEQIRTLRGELAARLTNMASDMKNLQGATQLVGRQAEASTPPGYKTLPSSDDAPGRRIAELEPQIAELQATENRLTLELEAKTREIDNVGSLQRELRSAETALQRVDQEVREADRRDLSEAQREFEEASSLLSAALARLPLASREVGRMRRLLNDKMADINGVIARAKPFLQGPAADTDPGWVEECRRLRNGHSAALREVLAQYEEEEACLSAALPEVPAEIKGLVRSIDRVDCGAGTLSRFQREKPAPDPGDETVGLGIQAGGCGSDPPEGRTYVPALANTGMDYKQALVAVRLAGLRGSALGVDSAAGGEEGYVTRQKPEPCTLVPVGATVEIAYTTRRASAKDSGGRTQDSR